LGCVNAKRTTSDKSNPSTTDWHGDAYDQISAPHAAMGAPALDRQGLNGDCVRLNITARLA